MFEHFTSEAIRVIMLAQEEARRLGHNFVGTEQILLGLMGEGTGVAAKVLAELGVTLKEARREVEKIIGRGSGFVPPEIPFTPKVKSLFEQSFREANFELTDDQTLPHDALDALRAQRLINLSGFNMSMTRRGNIYRSSVLMRGTYIAVDASV